MASADLNQQEDEGFLALLKPIQDVTRNWDVDLSLHLEEYLNHIREICGDKLPDMNFAQAAVLVQNSANIYSKKVDFLFMTVMELLDNITKKRNNAKGNAEGDGGEEGEEEGQQAGPRRRRAAAMFDADEFNLMDDGYTDRNIYLDLEKERKKCIGRKKPSIVMNPPSKSAATTDGKLSCTVYDHTNKPLGKKDEFRLNWRVSSEGILHEEFVVNKTAIAAMEPVEITVIENGVGSDNEADHDYDDVEAGDAEPPQDDDNAFPLNSSLLSIAPGNPERESEVRRVGHVNNAGNQVDVIEANTIDKDKIENSKLKEWEPNDFDNVLEDKPIRRRNAVKIPPELNANENKRKHSKAHDFELFTITDILINPGKEGSETFGKDTDFSFQAKNILKEKKKRLQQHRLKQKAALQGNARSDQLAGFPEIEDDDDSSDGYNGFGDTDQDEELDEPVNDIDIISSQGNQNWNGDDPDSYEATAKKCMDVFNKRKNDEFGKLTPEMAIRVLSWHQKVIPLLEAAEERSSFDIHGYGTKILDHFENKIGSSKLFKEIVGGEPPQEVSRYFLSTLLLTNQYNVEINKISSKPLEKDCISLKLLSTVRHHEELDDNMQLTTER